MSNLREMHYELRCLDCGNDGSEPGRSDILRPNTNKGFLVEVEVREDYVVDGTGGFYGGGDYYWPLRFLWNTLRCLNCASTNVQRKRRYRRKQS